MSLQPSTLSSLGLFMKSNVRMKPIPPPKDLSLRGQTALITGGNSGLGFEAAKQLLQHGLSRLVITSRSAEKGKKAADSLRASCQNPDSEILVWELDMLSYDSIQQFVRRCESELLPLGNSVSGRGLDIAILNAGVAQAVFAINRSTGHEETFQTNYLSTALLAILLLPLLKGKGKPKVGSKPGRLSIVGSSTGLTAAFGNRNANPLIPSFDDQHHWEEMGAFERYSVSKTLVMVLLAQLGKQELVDEDGNGVQVNAFEPGFVRGTNCKK